MTNTPIFSATLAAYPYPELTVDISFTWKTPRSTKTSTPKVGARPIRRKKGGSATR